MSLLQQEPRVPDPPPRPKRPTYETIKQGIKQLYPPENSSSSTNIDVVFIPGLGTNPEESWKSTRSDFNWASDKNGIAKDYPNARILLYMYESAFHGPLKVQQFMDDVAKNLLHGLKTIRGEQINRPLVFIGHSMGGLVIAKAVVMMDSQRDNFKRMLEATVGCIFFGSPFNGAQAASVAAMFSYWGEKFGQTTTSKLLDVMKPGDASLRELRGDFMRLVGKLSPKIELFCFWENHDTDIAKMAADFVAKRGPAVVAGRVSGAFYDLFKKANGSIRIVERESATFGDVVENLGLACNHRDLVKFEDFKDPRYQIIRDPLKRIIHGAPLAAKNRLNSTRDIDLEAIGKISEALESSVSAQSMRKRIGLKFSPSSWIPKDEEFCDWLAKENDPEQSRGDCLWVLGAEGRGKTGATIAALQEIEKVLKNNEQIDNGKAPTLLAYYFCDSTSDVVTAEELLKSLLWQLIQKQPLFVPYVKQFTRRDKRQPVPTSVENLWQSLQDMLSDDTASCRIYFVVNNISGLPPDNDSTGKFLDLILGDMKVMNDPEIPRTSIRWMFTSRKANRSMSGVRLIDLEDDRYRDQVQLELRKHAMKKVTMLGKEKNYKKDLAYFVSTLIGTRAQNTGWIDMTCGQLEELPESENALKVRQTLKSLPQQLDDLLNEGWKNIFNWNPTHVDMMKDMLQALMLTYEEPTLQELAILAGLREDEQGLEELRDLVGRCKVFLTLKGKPDTKVCFKNIIVKPHLLRHANKLLNVSEEEIRWLHGEMALRSFSHLMERFDIPEPEEVSAEVEADAAASVAHPEQGDEDNDYEATASENGGEEEEKEEEAEEEEEVEEDKEDYDSDDSTNEKPVEPDITALPYMVKHWLHHASKSTAEMADNLSLETSFWKPDSSFRRHWMDHFNYLDESFRGLDYTSLSALHVAASIGFRQLVVALMNNGYEAEMNQCDSMSNTPLHLAAFFGRPNIVDELLRRGARVDEGKEQEVMTPLSMASAKGVVNLMKMLLAAGADPNSIDSDVGPPLNVAIDSGNCDAVRLLVENGAEISPEPDERYYSPLANAACATDLSSFEYLMDIGKDRLRPHDYDSAFVAAAYYGNAETFRKLLEYEHSDITLQEALNTATEELEWDIVRMLLKEYPNRLDCNKLFLEVARGYEDQDELLGTVWKYTKGEIYHETENDSLYCATDNEKESTVKYLLQTCKANPNASGDDYGNALTASAYDGTMDIVKLLVEAGADVNSPDGWALQAAAGEGHEEVVKYLLEKGADVNACTSNENFPQGTALQAACEAGKVETVQLLLENHANPNLGAGAFEYPILAATMKGEERILELLVKHKADLDILGGPDSSSPLIQAAMFMPKKSLQLLLDADADINLADNDGDTALIMSALRGDEESVEFLLQRGADVMVMSQVRGINALQAAFQGENRVCLELVIDHVSELLRPQNTSTSVGGAHSEADTEGTDAEIGHSVGEGNESAEDVSEVISEYL